MFTGRPGTVKRIFDVPLPRPRNVFASRKHPSFAPLLERLWNDMSGAMDGAEFDPQR